jgi:hypothetical protein
MSDDDELANLLNDIESSDDSPGVSDVDVSTSDVSDIEEARAEEYSMSSDDDSASYSSDDNSITQAEVYDNLKRIGELEDEKQRIQDELRTRTEQLRSMLKHIDRGSILYKMLQSALADSATKAAAAKPVKKAVSKPAPKAAAKKAPKKKARRK